MEGLIPLVYRAVAEYRKRRQQQQLLALGLGSSCLQRYNDQPPSRALLFCDSAMSPARALMSPLLRSPPSRRHCAAQVRVVVMAKEN
ncbi:uncharacterized protein [Triticum aestivum]|uniref:Uncharacterized protein n=1 Tax=Aegilops tauschii subsp. strangulata TaxID=200361 RepID=A0A453BMW9_AEGTS|nr:uncharacterized protein LOC123049251 [Triticum aestivum]